VKGKVGLVLVLKTESSDHQLERVDFFESLLEEMKDVNLFERML
jgi:hypothetical protein